MFLIYKGIIISIYQDCCTGVVVENPGSNFSQEAWKKWKTGMSICKRGSDIHCSNGGAFVNAASRCSEEGGYGQLLIISEDMCRRLLVAWARKDH